MRDGRGPGYPSDRLEPPALLRGLRVGTEPDTDQPPAAADDWGAPRHRRIGVTVAAMSTLAATAAIAYWAMRAPLEFGQKSPPATADSGSVAVQGVNADMGTASKSSVVRSHLSAALLAGGIASGAVGQAVQWQTANGGNGHWYQPVGADVPGQVICWSTARDLCRAVGGELVSINSQQEELFLVQACALRGWIGYQPNGLWSSGEPITYTHWGPGQPSGDGPYADAYCNVGSWNGLWNDIGGTAGCWNGLASYTIEWSADCNNDGIVDYGQIRDGTLTDANGNNIPDCCEAGANCCPGDINGDHVVNGADVGILLGFWGDVGPLTPPRVDINRDGVVNGADLGMLLSGWGACGN